MDVNEHKLTELFRRLGAHNPAAWAHSQLEENLPQLARFLFLREAWKLVIKDGDVSWISELGRVKSNSPAGDAGPAVIRLLSGDVRQDDLATVVRVMQWRLLSGLCQLLDDPGDLEGEVKDIAWRLFQVDENERPTVALGGLAESVLETEPSGR